MTFNNDFLDCFSDSIVIKAPTTVIGAYGQTNLAAGTTYKGIFQQTQRLVRANDGNEKLSTANVIINTTATINPNAQVTLPDGVNRPVISVQTHYDEDGGHHVTIDFG